MSKSRAVIGAVEFLDSKDPEHGGSATGPWQIAGLGASSRSTIKLSELLFPMHFLMAMALTPMTAVNDPWRQQGQNQNAFVETWREVRRRKMNLRDARRLALLTMANAEKARAMLVEAEFQLVSRLEG